MGSFGMMGVIITIALPYQLATMYAEIAGNSMFQTQRVLSHRAFPRKKSEARWTDIPPQGATPLRNPKLAVLMMVKDAILFEDVWQKWLDTAGDLLQPVLFIHAFGITNPSAFRTASFASSLVWPPVPSRWCDIWEIEMLLMRHALRDPDVTHMATVSDDSIPLKPVSFIYNALVDEPATRMCNSSRSNDHHRAETWWLMSRKDGQLFLDHSDIANATFRTYGNCTEETSWLYPLRLRQTRWKSRSRLVKECVMFTDWTGHNRRDFIYHAALCDCPNLTRGVFTPSPGHPRSFSVSKIGWFELRRSPFWFGRKIEELNVPTDDFWRLLN
eukprot:TRINITY_DN9097_c0_g1_i1.p1 TRINITY_DN9097_c0_g1~~TRINITY_DN9097_c0_g1_i1.p1  ORF type:complete len:350 (+),score=34.34 TRINITY_DN9097_c0_g1_i1:65-1051(+)